MAIDRETVKHVAHLARLKVETQELEKLSQQLQEILNFIDQLNKVQIKNINPTSHILPINNVLREDKPRDSLTVSDVLANAPQKEDNFFIVPKVIE